MHFMHQKEIDVIKRKSNGEKWLLDSYDSSSRKNESSFFGRVKFVHLKRTPFFIRYFPNKPMTVWVEFQMNLSAFLELPLVTNDSLPKKNNITRRF